jgi:septin 3/9/12
MAAAMPEGNAVFPRSHVGFDSITQQIEKKLLKRGFQFNVICVGGFSFTDVVVCFSLTRCSTAGQTGLGKSTLINTIFASHLIDSKGRLRPDQEMKKTTEIDAKSHSSCFTRYDSSSL